MSVQLLETAADGIERPVDGTFTDETEADAEAKRRRLAALKAGTKPAKLPRYRIAPAENDG